MIVLSSDTRHLAKLKKVANLEYSDSMEENALAFLTVDELIEFLDKVKAGAASTESTVSGYKVKVSFTTSDEVETKIREESLAKLVLG